MYGGGGNWFEFSADNGTILAINGTANQIDASTTLGTTTLSIPSTFIAPGSIASTTTITAATGLTVSAGGAAITGNSSITGTLTTSLGITATTGNIAASSGDVSASGTVTGGTGVTATAGNVTATAGAVNAGTSMTATSGNITATNGNFVGTAVGTGLSFTNAGLASGVAASPVVLNARVGEAVFTTVSIAGGADLTLTMTNNKITGSSTQILFSLSGVTTGAALSIKSYTPSAGSVAIVITNGTALTTSVSDITLNFLVLN